MRENSSEEDNSDDKEEIIRQTKLLKQKEIEIQREREILEREKKELEKEKLKFEEIKRLSSSSVSQSDEILKPIFRRDNLGNTTSVHDLLKESYSPIQRSIEKPQVVTTEPPHPRIESRSSNELPIYSYEELTVRMIMINSLDNALPSRCGSDKKRMSLIR